MFVAADLVRVYLYFGLPDRALDTLHFFALATRALAAQGDAFGTLPIAVPSLFTIFGTVAPCQTKLYSLAGYENALPVCIGNCGTLSPGLDSYGSLIEAFYLVELEAEFGIPEPWVNAVMALAFTIELHWMKPSHGIIITCVCAQPPRRYTYAAMQYWRALDRAFKLISLQRSALTRSSALQTAATRFRIARDKILRFIQSCFSHEDGAYMSYPQSHELDASVLVWQTFYDKPDPRAVSTLEIMSKRVEDGGLAENKLFHQSSLEKGQHNFVFFSFLAARCLVHAEDFEAAEQTLEHLVGFVSAETGLMCVPRPALTTCVWCSLPLPLALLFSPRLPFSPLPSAITIAVAPRAQERGG